MGTEDVKVTAMNILYFRIPHNTLFCPPPPPPSPQILNKLLFPNALGDTAYSQEHLKTMVYVKFGGQTKCIMGNSKIDNVQVQGRVTFLQTLAV